MEETLHLAASANRCPACGAPLSPDARSCLSCGSMMVAAPEMTTQSVGAIASPRVTDPPRAEPLRAPQDAAPIDAIPVVAPVALSPGEQRCQWCGGVSPAEADRCAHCQAAFPDPARDAVMLAEAQRRLTIIEQELDARKRVRRFWSRPF